MRYPTNWISITQGFHVGKHLDFGWCSHHNQDVYACADGTVKSLEVQSMGGNVIYLEHTNGMVSSYAHLKSFDVKVNQKVKLGQKIGVMGATGGAVGEHLDFALYKNFSVRYKNSTINPFDYLEVYDGQEVREDTLKQYGKYIKYHSENYWTTGWYQLIKSKAVRKSHNLGNNIKKVKECASWDKSAKNMLTSKKPNDDAYLKAGSKIEITQIYNENGRIWGKWGNSGVDWIVLCNVDGTAQSTKI